MITFFSIPKAFKGHDEIIQSNAIISWLKIPEVEIILYGDEIGMEKFSETHHVKNIKEIKKN